MNHKAGKLLVVESDDALRDHIVAVLSDAGGEVSTDYRDGMKAVLAFDPDAVILGADSPSSIAVTFFPKLRVPSTLITYALLCYLREDQASALEGWILGPTMCCHCLSTHTNSLIRIALKSESVRSGISQTSDSSFQLSFFGRCFRAPYLITQTAGLAALYLAAL